MRGMRFILVLALTVPVMALQGFALQGELNLYGSAILDGGEYAKNSAELTITASERVGQSMIKTEVDCVWSSVHERQPDILIREASWKRVFEISEEGLLRSVTTSAGMLRFTWGKSDELRVLDIINPNISIL